MCQKKYWPDPLFPQPGRRIGMHFAVLVNSEEIVTYNSTTVMAEHSSFNCMRPSRLPSIHQFFQMENTQKTIGGGCGLWITECLPYQSILWKPSRGLMLDRLVLCSCLDTRTRQLFATSADREWSIFAASKLAIVAFIKQPVAEICIANVAAKQFTSFRVIIKCFT